MGKQSVAIAQEFSKLGVLLVQTANAVNKCLKTLKENLGRYDRRHGLYFRHASRYFMRSDIRVAKDLATDLRHVAKRIYTSKNPTKSEINAARISMNATADAMNDLKQSGRIYDQNRNNGVAGDVMSVMDNILGGNDNNPKNDNEGSFGSGDGKLKTKGKLFGHKRIGTRILKSPETVEAVVSSTLREDFCGFSGLKQQITATENAMSPSLMTRAKDAVVEVANKLVIPAQAQHAMTH